MKKINLKIKILLSIIIVFAISLFFNKVFAATYENLTYEIDTYTKEITILGCTDGTTDLEIPNEINGYKVTSISSYAFSGCSSLESVNISSGITSIGSGAFSECTNLKSVNISSGVTHLPTEMFDNCINLTNVTIPSSVTDIGPEVFYGCTKLKNITIPSSVTDIGSYAFMRCTSLSNITLPSGLEYLAEGSFEYCTSLEQIEIPMTLNRIRDWTFDGCTNLKKIVIPYTINSIESVFEDVSPDLVVYVAKDSYADIYAINNDFKTAYYTIPLSKCSITGITNKNYAGYNLTQNVNIKYGGYTLKNGSDFTVSYANNKNVGTATMTITGKYAFSGTITKNFTITPKNLSGCTIVNISDQTYTGKEIKPSVVVKNGTTILQEGIDYTVTYKNNKNIGIATAYITGKGNYTKTVSKNFNIIPKDISKCTMTKISNQMYTGKAIKPSIKVKYGNTTLKNGVDYTISYKNNTNVGTATITITGKGIYNKTKTIKFNIVQVTDFKIASKTTNSINLSWKRAKGATGYEIYSYNYSKKKWTYIGKTSDNKYTVENLSAGNTYRFRIRAYKNISGKRYYGAYVPSVKTTITLPATKITSLTTSSKKATLKWNKVSGASGYELYMATSRNGKYTKVKTTSAVKYTKSNLRSNKTYYFKIRTYKKVNGKKVYSSYSTIKAVKIK